MGWIERGLQSQKRTAGSTLFALAVHVLSAMGRPLLDANCPFATTIISTSNRTAPGLDCRGTRAVYKPTALQRSATVLQSLHNRVKTTACKPWNQRPCQQRDRTRYCSPPAPVNSTPRRVALTATWISIRQVSPLFPPVMHVDCGTDRHAFMNRRRITLYVIDFFSNGVDFCR